MPAVLATHPVLWPFPSLCPSGDGQEIPPPCTPGQGCHQPMGGEMRGICQPLTWVCGLLGSTTGFGTVSQVVLPGEVLYWRSTVCTAGLWLGAETQ